MEDVKSGSIIKEELQFKISDSDITPLRDGGMGPWEKLIDSSKNKVFCTCGAIADLDSTVVNLKKRLGKDVECRHCRNRRISKELRELRELYSEDKEDWLYS